MDGANICHWLIISGNLYRNGLFPDIFWTFSRIGVLWGAREPHICFEKTWSMIKFQNLTVLIWFGDSSRFSASIARMFHRKALILDDLGAVLFNFVCLRYLFYVVVLLSFLFFRIFKSCLDFSILFFRFLAFFCVGCMNFRRKILILDDVWGRAFA